MNFRVDGTFAETVRRGGKESGEKGRRGRERDREIGREKEKEA